MLLAAAALVLWTTMIPPAGISAVIDAGVPAALVAWTPNVMLTCALCALLVLRVRRTM
jgi:hypothetical protein